MSVLVWNGSGDPTQYQRSVFCLRSILDEEKLWRVSMTISLRIPYFLTYFPLFKFYLFTAYNNLILFSSPRPSL